MRLNKVHTRLIMLSEGECPLALPHHRQLECSCLLEPQFQVHTQFVSVQSVNWTVQAQGVHYKALVCFTCALVLL